MALREQHGLSGRLHIVVSDSTGRIIEERHVKNLIADEGRLVLAQLFSGQAQANELRIVVGTNGAALEPDKVRIDPIANAPASVIVNDKILDGRAQARVVATLPASDDPNPQAIQEAGIVIVLPDRQVVYNRVTFPVVNRAGTLEMTFTWEVSF